MVRCSDAQRWAGEHLVVDAVHGLSIHAIKLPCLPQQGVLKHALQHVKHLKRVAEPTPKYNLVHIHPNTELPVTKA